MLRAGGNGASNPFPPPAHLRLRGAPHDPKERIRRAGAPMSRWWRAYDEAADDPKLQRLSGDLFKSWFNLLCLSSRNHGVLPSISDISFGLRKPESECQQIIDYLTLSGLFDDDDGKISPHNWAGRQFQSDTSTPRVQRYRKRLRNVSRNGHATPNETDQSRADTDSE